MLVRTWPQQLNFEHKFGDDPVHYVGPQPSVCTVSFPIFNGNGAKENRQRDPNETRLSGQGATVGRYYIIKLFVAQCSGGHRRPHNLNLI